MRKAKLPTTKDKRCSNCNAIIIHSYDYQNAVYKYQCGNCGATRYESGAKFETRFIGADRL